MPFRIPTRLYFGPGSRFHIQDALRYHGRKRILMVTDTGLRDTPWPEHILSALRELSLDVTIEHSIEQNPRAATIDAITSRARSEAVDLVIGVGGGSVLDAGKTVAMLLNNPGSCLDYEGRNTFSHHSAPFIALPSTCGTGSEVTWVSVISDPDQQRKVSIKGESMFPDDALVDPDLLITLPPHLVAFTGMDAYTHAIEAYTCARANPISDALAEKAIQLLDTYLPKAFQDIEDDEARMQIMRAATLAGMAFGNADVAGVHCLSESLGGLFDIPHGLGNAILLLPVLRYHRPAIAEKLTTLYVQLRPHAPTPVHAEAGSLGMLEIIEELSVQLEIPTFDTLALPSASYPRIAAESVKNNSNASNPRRMTEKDYLAILERC